jgi:hypothetical protein
MMHGILRSHGLEGILMAASRFIGGRVIALCLGSGFGVCCLLPGLLPDICIALLSIRPISLSRSDAKSTVFPGLDIQRNGRKIFLGRLRHLHWPSKNSLSTSIPTPDGDRILLRSFSYVPDYTYQIRSV